MRRLLTWLDVTLPQGLYAASFRSAVDWCDSRLSLNEWLYRCVRLKLAIGPNDKSPAWFSEIYQLIWIGIEAVLLFMARSPGHLARYAVAGVALYRCLEILLFAVGWVFVHTSYIHSYRRSLVGFLLNVGEVVVCFAAAGLALHCVPADSVFPVLYSSLRTTVTIGPLSTMEPGCSTCYALTTSQIGISYFLAAVILAGVVGSLRRREEYPQRPAAGGSKGAA